MSEESKLECVGIFKAWISEQVDSWLREWESWDIMLEDGDVTEEQIEYIQNNLHLVDCVIKTK